MNFLNIENFLGNSSFCFLFLSMIFYWIQLAFDFQRWNFGKVFMILANFSLLNLLLFRWVDSGHFPLSNLYESLIFLAWSLSTFHFILEMNYFSQPKKVEFFPFSQKKMMVAQPASLSSEISSSPFFEEGKNEKKKEEEFIGETTPKEKAFFTAFTSPAPLFINAFATFTLPTQMQHSSPLVPALQSNWLMMHVTLMILSYSALICGSLLSIAFLIITFNFDFDSLTNLKNFPPFKNENKKSFKQSFAEILDNLSYRVIGLGFPFLTIGILSGAVWANEAWGSYWSWDPKETWALATWLIFAIYLHTRLTKGWSGKKPAYIATFGFFIVWICFLGVNLLGEGLHSYGFFQK
jgi:cytochrome c-type biogenesis protein CcsB